MVHTIFESGCLPNPMKGEHTAFFPYSHHRGSATMVRPVEAAVACGP